MGNDISSYEPSDDDDDDLTMVMLTLELLLLVLDQQEQFIVQRLDQVNKELCKKIILGEVKRGLYN